MYNVVFQTKVGTSQGAVTWSTFKDQNTFNNWHNQEMKDWYEVLTQGVTEERAIELCSTPQAKLAAVISQLRELGQELRIQQ